MLKLKWEVEVEEELLAVRESVLGVEETMFLGVMEVWEVKFLEEMEV